MLAKSYAWSNLFGPGHFIRVGLPILLIMVAAIGALISAITADSLTLVALAMALGIQLHFIVVSVFAQGIRSQGRFSPTHILKFVRASSHLLLVAAIIFQLWILGLLFIRLFQPSHIEIDLLLITAASISLVNGIAAYLLENKICSTRYFRSRAGLLKTLLTPSGIAFAVGVIATLTDKRLIVDDIGALLIMCWFMSSIRSDNISM